MGKYCLIYFLVTIVLCSPIIPYKGLRVVIKKEDLKIDFDNFYISIAEMLKNAKWEDVTKSGFLSMKVSNLKCTGKYDSTTAKYQSMIITEKKIVTTHSGHGFLVNYEFDYAYGLFGLNFMSGKGTAAFQSSSTVLQQDYQDTEVKSNLKISFSLTLKLGGFDFGIFTAQANTLFANQVQVKLESTLSSYLSAGYSRVWASFLIKKIPLYANHKLDMMLSSSVVSLNESPQGFLAIGMGTGVTVEDRPYWKSIEKTLTSPIIDIQSGIQYCMANTLFPAILEVQNKARDFIFSLEPKKIGLTGTVRDLIHAMPTLEQMYDPSLPIYLGCRPTPGVSIIRINDTHNKDLRVQIPIDCSFGISSLGKELLFFKFVVRTTLKPMTDYDDHGIKVSAALVKPEMYEFAITKSVVPVAQGEIILYNAGRISELIDQFYVVPQGIEFSAAFEVSKHIEKLNEEEYCFTLTHD